MEALSDMKGLAKMVARGELGWFVKINQIKIRNILKFIKFNLLCVIYSENIIKNILM